MWEDNRKTHSQFLDLPLKKWLGYNNRSNPYVSWQTWHCSRLLLSAGRGAIDRYLLATGLTAANPSQRRAAAEWRQGRTDRQTDRQTDGRTLDSFIDTALHTMRAVSITEWQRTGINGESTSMVWQTLASSTAREQKTTEQNRTEQCQ